MGQGCLIAQKTKARMTPGQFSKVKIFHNCRYRISRSRRHWQFYRDGKGESPCRSPARLQFNRPVCLFHQPFDETCAVAFC